MYPQLPWNTYTYTHIYIYITLYNINIVVKISLGGLNVSMLISNENLKSISYIHFARYTQYIYVQGCRNISTCNDVYFYLIIYCESKFYHNPLYNCMGFKSWRIEHKLSWCEIILSWLCISGSGTDTTTLIRLLNFVAFYRKRDWVISMSFS